MLKEAPQGKLGRLAPFLAAVPALVVAAFLVIQALDYGVVSQVGPVDRRIGQEIDRFQGIPVYFNGPFSNVTGPSVGAGGYSYGQKYQCMEFVLRYFHEVHGHVMPDAEGRPKEFFDPSLADGAFNVRRGLVQYVNGGETCPVVGDLIVFDGLAYGQAGIVSDVTAGDIEFVQQNRGPHKPPRARLGLNVQEDAVNGGEENGSAVAVYTLSGEVQVLGWLRAPIP